MKKREEIEKEKREREEKGKREREERGNNCEFFVISLLGPRYFFWQTVQRPLWERCPEMTILGPKTWDCSTIFKKNIFLEDSPSFL
jgi:hypothetical protein